MRKTAESLRIERCFSLPYLPRQNKVERMHRTIGPLLKAVLAKNKDHDNWPKYLSEILIGYNTSVHSVTGFTPQRLQTGSEYPGPLMRWVNPPVLEEEEDIATRTIRETREATVRNLRALTNLPCMLRPGTTRQDRGCRCRTPRASTRPSPRG